MFTITAPVGAMFTFTAPSDRSSSEEDEFDEKFPREEAEESSSSDASPSDSSSSIFITVCKRFALSSGGRALQLAWAASAAHSPSNITSPAWALTRTARNRRGTMFEK
jgi:hypothetical protein